MQKILYTLLVGLSVMLSSCVKDTLDAVPQGKGDGVSIYLRLPERKEVLTRSGDTPAEELIDGKSVYILVMSSNEDNAVLLDFGVATEIQQGSVNSYHIKLAEQKQACHAYIIVNAKDIMDVQVASWVENTTTFATIATALQTATLVNTNGVITAMPASHPMTGSCTLSGISTSMSIGSASSPIALSPVTVKVTVENHVQTGAGYTFDMNGANLGSSPEQSFIMPSQTGDIPTHNYGKDGDLSSMMAGVTTIEGIQTTESLFGYESKAENSTFVIVKASYNDADGYYKLGFYTDSDKQNSRPLLRGYHYKMSIRKVLTAGYRTIDEAISSPTSNGILYDIDVQDPDSYDIITNGVQYLGVSNSEYIMYNSNYVNHFELLYNDSEDISIATPFTATTLTYTADKSWSDGTVVASEGILLQNPDGTKSQQLTLNIPAIEGEAVRKELKIFMSDDFTSGQLDIRIGNLHKVIKVKRELSFSILGGAVSLGKNIAYASAATLPSAHMGAGTYDPNTFSLAYSQDGGAILTGNGDVATNTSQELFLQIKNRFPEGYRANYCFGEVYAHRNTSEGRAKISFAVELFGEDIFGDYSRNPQWSVAGAYWRNDQKGERLIQIAQTWIINMGLPDFPYYCGRWQVRVIAGQDFIRLAEWDESLTVTNNRFDGDPEDRSIENGKLMVTGKDLLIQFRIGLTGTNNGNPNRYGLIQLIYIDQRPTGKLVDPKKQSNFIFVRQGEAGDYVLTPGKSYNNYVRDYNAVGTPFIAPDVKFAPYPLIDPNSGPGGPDIADHPLISDSNRPVFAQYPSMLDYMFKWGGDRFIHPTNPKSPITNWDSTIPTSFQELCPEGYITPPATIDGTPIYNGIRAAFPHRGNSIRGIYLDGYIDRYIQVKNMGGYYSYTNHAPHTPINADDGSGLGMLFFNPETFASIYIPTSSMRVGPEFNNEGALLPDRNLDYEGMSWTQNMDEPNTPKWFSFGFNEMPYIRGEADPKYSAAAHRIRCIKDPSKP